MSADQPTLAGLIVSTPSRSLTTTTQIIWALAICTFSHSFRKNRKGWLQVVLGDVAIDQMHLVAGDGLALQDCDQVRISALSDTELLLFDMG